MLSSQPVHSKFCWLYQVQAAGTHFHPEGRGARTRTRKLILAWLLHRVSIVAPQYSSYLIERFTYSTSTSQKKYKLGGRHRRADKNSVRKFHIDRTLTLFLISLHTPSRLGRLTAFFKQGSAASLNSNLPAGLFHFICKKNPTNTKTIRIILFDYLSYVSFQNN